MAQVAWGSRDHKNNVIVSIVTVSIVTVSIVTVSIIVT
jgi:hypothetical protein